MQADVGKLDIYVFKEGSFGRKGDELIRARRFCGTGKSSLEKKAFRPIEFQHQSIQISFFLSKKSPSNWDYILFIPWLNHFPNFKEKTKKKNKQNKQNTTTTETEPIFLHTKKHTKKSVGFLFERTSWSVERRRSAMPWPFRCTGHPRVSHKHPRPWYVSCRSRRNHVVVVVVFLEGVEMK